MGSATESYTISQKVAFLQHHIWKSPEKGKQYTDQKLLLNNESPGTILNQVAVAQRSKYWITASTKASA